MRHLWTAAFILQANAFDSCYLSVNILLWVCLRSVVTFELRTAAVDCHVAFFVVSINIDYQFSFDFKWRLSICDSLLIAGDDCRLSTYILLRVKLIDCHFTSDSRRWRKLRHVPLRYPVPSVRLQTEIPVLEGTVLFSFVSQHVVAKLSEADPSGRAV